MKVLGERVDNKDEDEECERIEKPPEDSGGDSKAPSRLEG